MRILFIQNRYRDGSPGGTEQMCRQLGEGLRVRGHQVAMLTSCQSSPSKVFTRLWPRLSMLEADWMHRGGPAAGAIWLANHLWNYQVTRSVIKAFRPDAVFVHNSENILAGPLNAAVDSGTRVVLQAHNHLYDQWAGSKARLSRLGRMIRPKLEGAVFIAVSRHMAAELEKAGIPADRIATIHNGLPESIFKLTDGPRRNGTVIFAGSMAEHKGFHIFLEAASILKQRHQQVIFEAWGHQVPGQYRNKWLKQARESGLCEKLKLNGPVERDELWRIFDRSDVLVVPSLYPEAFGLVAAEAMCRGMIVVVSNRGGLPEVVGDCGFIVEPTPLEVAGACLRALEMPEGRKGAMRRAARERVGKNFRFSSSLPKYEAILRPQPMNIG